MKKENYLYSGLGERLSFEWKIYLAALVFIIIADSIGQIRIPVGPGVLILFPIFYSIFWEFCPDRRLLSFSIIKL